MHTMRWITGRGFQKGNWPCLDKLEKVFSKTTEANIIISYFNTLFIRLINRVLFNLYTVEYPPLFPTIEKSQIPV